MTRIVATDLVPGTPYAVQVRSVRNGQYSEWSEKFTFTTDQNLSQPAAPATTTWVVSDDAFAGTWTEVTQDLGGSAAYIVSYDLKMVSGATTVVVTVPAQKGFGGNYTLDFPTNTALFGTPVPGITFSVRAVNNKGVKGVYSSGILATNAVPANVSGFAANALQDAIELSWTANTENDLDHYEVFTSTSSSSFTPTTGNRIFQGKTTRFVYRTTSYVVNYFKIRAYDKFGQPSATDASASATPLSPFVLDTTAPATPTSLAGTITNNANGIGAVSAMTWTMSSPPSDLAGFNIRFRKVGTTPYDYQTGIDSAARASTIILDTAYQNYEFQIQAYDFSGNQSAFSSTVTVTSPANAAPAVPTSFTSVPANNAITYSWVNTDVDIYNYEVTFSTSSTFASGNITYLTGTAKTLTVGGLSYGTTYYARVRSVDTAGSTSSFTSTNTTTTGAAPATSDGAVPSSSPAAPNVLSGLSYLYITWTPITNNDPVTYEVHLSTTTGFTPSGATKVTEVMGSSAVVDILPGTTTPLSYGTTYFIKIIAKDKDGSAAAGSQGSGTISKVASTDVTSIGADLIVPGTGFVNALVVASGGSMQSSNWVSLTTGWKIATTGIEMNDANSKIKVEALQAGTIGGSGGSGVINIAAGSSLKMNGGAFYSNTYGGSTYNSGATAGWFMDDTHFHIPQGQISAAAFIGGSFSTGTITMSGGSITGGSWTLSSSGLSIPNGGVSAAAITLQIGSNLLPPQYADFEFQSGYYTAGLLLTNGTATIDTTDFYFNKQSLKWTTTATSNFLQFGTTTTDYNFVMNPSTTYIVSYYAMIKTGATAMAIAPWIKTPPSGTLTSGGSSGTIPANSVWNRYSTTITVPGTGTGMAQLFFFNNTTGGPVYIDGVQVEEKVSNSTTPSTWNPPGATTVSGQSIKTGAIQSNQPALDANGGVISGQLAWSIDPTGNATFGNVNVRGLMVFGILADQTTSLDAAGNEVDLTGVSQVQSANYSPNNAGWAIRSNGVAEFQQLKANSVSAASIKAVDPNKINAGSVTSPLVIASQLISQDSAAFTFTDRTVTSNIVTMTVGTHNRQVGDRVQIKHDAIIPSLRALTSNVVTLTLPTNHGFITGDSVVVAGYTSTDAVFNGTYTVTGFTSTTITYALTNANVTSGAGTGAPTVTDATLSTPGSTYDTVIAVTSSTFSYARTRTNQATVSLTGVATFTGRSVVTDPTGVTLYDNDGLSVVVDLPTAPGGDAYFAGSINASALVVRDNFSLQGDNNVLNAGSTMVLNNGIVAPASAPSVSQSYDNVITQVAGGNNYGLQWDGTYFTTVQNFFGTTAARFKANGDFVVSQTLPNTANVLGPYGGIIRIGTTWYVLGSRYDTGVWEVWTFNASWSTGSAAFTYDEHTAYGVTATGWKNTASGVLKDPVIGTDGTSIFIARCDASGLIKIAKYNTSGTKQTGSPFAGAGNLLNTGIQDFQNLRGLQIGIAGGFDFGAVDRYLVTTEGNATKTSRTYSHSGSAAQSNEYFYSPNQNKTAGIVWNGSAFQTLGAGGTLYTHTAIALNGSNAWSVKSSWYDGDTSSIVPSLRALTSNVATLTVTAGHGYVVGDLINVAGYTSTDAIFNGTGITVTAATSTTISYALVSGNVTSGAGTGSPTIATLAYESPLSIGAPFTVTRRAKLTLTGGSIPDSGRHNDPDRVRFYVSNTGLSGTHYRQTDLAVGGKQVTFTANPTFSGSTGPGTAFPAGTAARFVSSNGKLELNADGYGLFGATKDADTTAGNTPALRIGDITAGHLRVDGNEIQAMGTDTTTAPFLLNAGGGNVTLGANSGTGALNVNGSGGLNVNHINGTVTLLSLNSTNGGNNASSGPMYCRVGAGGALFSSTTAPSSRAIKHDIQDLELDYRDVLKLQPKTFRYNDMPDTLRIGFIAEEADELGLGEHGMVGYEDSDDPTKPTGFDYDGFDAALLLVVQAQQKQIDELTRRLDALGS